MHFVLQSITYINRTACIYSFIPNIPVDKCTENPINNFLITWWISTFPVLHHLIYGYPQGYYEVFSKFFADFDRKKI